MNNKTVSIIKQVHHRFGNAEIRELKAAEDYCLLRLRDGKLFLARLDRRNTLVLEELDEVC